MDTVQETGPLLRFNGWNDVWVGIEFREKIEYLAEPVTYNPTYSGLFSYPLIADSPQLPTYTVLSS